MNWRLILSFILSGTMVIASLAFATPSPIIRENTQIGTSSGTGFYNITTIVWFEQLLVNSTNITFYGLHPNNQTANDTNTGELLCDSVENCTLPAIDYIRNITFIPSGTTSTTSTSTTSTTTTSIPTTVPGGHQPPPPQCTTNNDCYYWEICVDYKCETVICNGTQILFNHTCISLPINITVEDILPRLNLTFGNLTITPIIESNIESFDQLYNTMLSGYVVLSNFLSTPLVWSQGLVFNILHLVIVITLLLSVYAVYRSYNGKKVKRSEIDEFFSPETI